MAPLIALVVGFLAARLAGWAGVDALDGWHPALRVGLATLFLVTTSAHFVPAMRRDLVAMVPPALPRPGLLVTVTGVLELAGAIGVLVPATATLAAAALALLMVLMFPANVSAARRAVPFGGRPATPIGIRTAEQVMYVGAAVAVVVGS
jgi:uncharacterized membrane protein